MRVQLTQKFIINEYIKNYLNKKQGKMNAHKHSNSQKTQLQLKLKQNSSQAANLSSNHPSYQTCQRTLKPSIKVGYKIINNKPGNDKPIKTGRKHVPSAYQIHEKQITTKNTSRVKIVDTVNNQYQSGKFVGSQYCKNNQNNQLKNSRYSKYSLGKVSDARDKYQLSNCTENCIKGQFIQKREPSCFANSRQNKSKTEISENMSLSRSKYTSTKQRQCLLNKNCNNNLSRNSYISQKRKLPSYSQQGIKDVMEYWHAGEYRQTKITQKCNNVQKDLKSRYAKFNDMHQFDFRKRIRQLQKVR